MTMVSFVNLFFEYNFHEFSIYWFCSHWNLNLNLLIPLPSHFEMFEMRFFSYSHFLLRTLSLLEWNHMEFRNSKWRKFAISNFFLFLIIFVGLSMMMNDLNHFEYLQCILLKATSLLLNCQRAFIAYKLVVAFTSSTSTVDPPFDPLFSSLLRLNHSLQLIECVVTVVCVVVDPASFVCCSTYHSISDFLWLLITWKTYSIRIVLRIFVHCYLCMLWWYESVTQFVNKSLCSQDYGSRMTDWLYSVKYPQHCLVHIPIFSSLLR